jgi:hypothetical protein
MANSCLGLPASTLFNPYYDNPIAITEVICEKALGQGSREKNGQENHVGPCLQVEGHPDGP